ncbi:ATP-binding protein [Sphingomonas abietis]|uniref:ATP-binding protein n=1 Tax=Sphingomonas abietis TaxID=3012344 RepID=A0ABY7NR67_9SPHN|nr:ATP-binding protein [Sphingomonas abietis]WBO24039.1 ATP-binding protein [Sphingomonas abietis]
MTVAVDMGTAPDGASAAMDLEELLATRLLVQGNSGSGKSHLLRRLLEGSAKWVQQVIVDPEGDFTTLSERFGHVVVDGGAHSEVELRRLALRIREQRVSVVLTLEGLEVEGQMRAAATFLSTMFDAPREHWYPALVVVDEAQLFAPSVAGEVSDEVRRLSLGAMTNLMCRGRKRGLAGVIATQRLAKLAKNVAAEASNFLMGRTFLDIDMARAADLLGLERRQAEQFRDLARGHFIALGPALSRRPLPIRIGDVETQARSASPKLMPLPTVPDEAQRASLFERPTELELPMPAPAPSPPRPSMEQLLRSIEAPAAAPEDSRLERSPEERDAIVAACLAEIVTDEGESFRPAAVLFQDFGVRCRMRGLTDAALDLAGFRTRLSLARAGLYAAIAEDDPMADAAREAETLPEDARGVFLLIARAALERMPCPSDIEIARVYGTHSTGRAKRLLGFLEQQGAIVVRIDLRGGRAIALPTLGWTTAVSDKASAEA